MFRAQNSINHSSFSAQQSEFVYLVLKSSILKSFSISSNKMTDRSTESTAKSPSSLLKILVATDIHLGYGEDTQIQGEPLIS